MVAQFKAYKRGVVVDTVEIPAEEYFEGYTEEKYEADAFDRGVDYDKLIVAFQVD